MRRMTLVIAAFAIATFGFAGTASASPPVKPAGVWTFQSDLLPFQGHSCEQVTFGKGNRWTGNELWGDSGTFKLQHRATELTMKWKTGLERGLTFVGTGSAQPVGEHGGVYSGTNGMTLYEAPLTALGSICFEGD